jgi:hypothetical protein
MYETIDLFQYSFSRSNNKKAHSVIYCLFALYCFWTRLGSGALKADTPDYLALDWIDNLTQDIIL